MMRKAVGALAVCDRRLLLVRKVLLTSARPHPVPISPEWGFPKGGVKESDASLEDALKRELSEEAGSDRFSILCRLENPFVLSFDDGPYTSLPYEGQETVMFLVEYLGPTEILEPQDGEIDMLGFFELPHALALLSDSPAGSYLRDVLSDGGTCGDAIRDRLF